MEGVRSVSEVLMLAAMEGYSFIPSRSAAKPADLGSREEMGKLRTLTDKAQVIEHLNKGFAHAKAELEALDPATLTAQAQDHGRADPVRLPTSRSASAATCTSTSGQMIAYARMNHIVPPWSK